MVRPKDPFWKYAENLKNGRFSCNFCHGQFAGGISRLKWHLSGHKTHDIKVCEKVPRDIRLAVQQVLDTPNKKDRHVEYENCTVPSSSDGRNLCMENDKVLMGENANNLVELIRAPNFCNEKDECQLLDKQLATWFFLFGIDPKAIVSPIFKDFVKSIGEYGPSYQLPSRNSLQRKLMFDVEKEAKEYVKNFIHDQVQASCTLLVNIWSNFEGDFTRGDIFAYSQSGLACLKSFNDKLESNRIRKDILSMINLLGPNRVVQLLISSDNRNWDFYSWEIKKHHPRIDARCCAAKEIDEFLRHMEWELCLIKLGEFIFNTYYRYNETFRRGMKIPKERSAFILLMLKSILKMEDELQDISFSSLIESSDEVKLPEKEKAVAKLLDYIIGRKEFWSQVKDVARVWVLLFQTQCLVNLEGSNIGYLYQMIERLKEEIEKSLEHDDVIYGCSWDSFMEMRQKIIHPLLAAAAFLDPVYMYAKTFEVNTEMMDGINYMFENMVDLDEKEAFMEDILQYRKKLPEFFTAQTITMLKTYHPRFWWDFCGKHTVSVLSKYAIRVLSQPCSTSFCRRYQLLRDDWGLKDWTTEVNAMIINENSKSLMLEPIILDKLGEDLDTFDDVTEQALDDFRFKYYCLLNIFDDKLVDCVINDSRPFWDNIGRIMDFL